MIQLSEVSPRDGLQPVREFVPTETKIELVRRAHAAGLRRMEVGSFVSPKAIPQMADTAAVLAAARELPGLECTVLVPNRRGFDAALANGAHRLGFFMSVTDGHSQANLNRSVANALEELSQLVRETPGQTRIRFNLSTCFHCPFEGVVNESAVMRLVHAVAPLREDMEIALCDTTGNAAPDQVWRVMARAVDHYGERFAFHGHDTYGMGVANCVAAWEAGCRVIDAAAGGIGGCPYAPGATGNVAMEDVVWTFTRMGVATGTDWVKLLEAADYAAAIPGATPGGRMRGVPAARAA
ncbi:MAG: hydroxymethylglutaryl-CoA lyase [Alphaproteobacteria bacterium]|nr:hydroxymethylglutaryl-CoA lyase [Alphaproteobacteria bacterium]